MCSLFGADSKELATWARESIVAQSDQRMIRQLLLQAHGPWSNCLPSVNGLSYCVENRGNNVSEPI